MILAKLRLIARARTEADYEENVKNFKSSEEWKTNPKLRNWIGNTWLSQYKKWVWTFRKDRLLTVINTNNGVERQNKAFKHEYLDGYKSSTLSVMLTVLIEDFLPDLYFKYVELNTKLQSNYRQYNYDVPSYLHERPHSMIRHCMERLASSEDTLASHIMVFDEMHGIFKVRSQDGICKFYTLSFGSDPGDFPSCDCYDWERHRLPCKHFFAIFKNFPFWSFDKLLKSYTESPFLTVDRIGCTSVMETKTFEVSQCHSDDSSQTVEAPEENEIHVTKDKNIFPTIVAELKRKPSSHRTEAARCRERLGQIKNLTYVAEGWGNGNVLHEVKVKLDECYKILTDVSPKENGLVLEVPDTKKSAPKCSVKNSKCLVNPFKPIPKPAKKNPWSGRSGAKAATLKRSYASTLTEIEGKLAKIGRNDSNIVTDEINSSHCRPIEPLNKESGDKLEKIVQTPKRGFFKLSDIDINIIITRKELTDHIIGAAHNVLQKQFPVVLGLENTTLGPVTNFSVHRGTFFQILHTGTHHWVLVSNIDCQPASVNLYDSLYNGRVSSLTTNCQPTP
ncbi:uncharacterized protein LOC124450228 [Xenia sp. Carnegie-2017]|uniref:uncharacterized protein LOC124450228 n=1 Tax=Xenia sp. Carnegie-2017 TaxID=2897299 RepID=UPI001F04BB9D|nr:uncharacterized protein LOC124450228 [Xenia sp. Carnegie-2017]